MAGTRVVYQEESRWPGWVWLLLWGVVAGTLLGLRMDPTPSPDQHWVLLLVVAIPVLFWFFVGRLHVVVTESSVRLRWGETGLLAKEIPFDTIEDVEAVTYHPIREFGGWGIRWGGQGKRAWTTGGDRAVRFRLRDGTLFYVSSPSTRRLRERVLTALELARKSRGGGSADGDREDS